MNYDVNKNSLSVRDLIFDGCKEMPVDLDFSLPEQCMDIQKVLKCRVCPNITSRSISGDRLNIEGVSKIRVIYLDCENKKVRCCENSVPFSCSIDIKSSPENATAITNLRVEYINCRAVSPRKLDIHGAFSIYTKIYHKKQLEISSKIEGENIEQKISEMNVNSLIGIGQQQFTISEVLEIEDKNISIETIINSDVILSINEYKNMNNKTVVKGEAIIKILYIHDSTSGSTETLDYSIPISQIIDVSGIDENSKCIIMSQVISHDEQISSKNDSKSNVISCETKIVATVMAYQNTPISLVSDAYSTDYNLDISSEHVKINQLQDYISENITHKDNIKLSDMHFSKIIDIWSDNLYSNCNFEDGILTSKCKINICILALDNEDIPVYLERVLEFSHTKPYDNNIDLESIKCESKLNSVSIKYSMSGTNTIDINAVIELLTEIYLCKKYQMITNILSDESQTIEKDNASLTVYYASEGENIWDIARKYYTSAEMIKEENEISEDKIKSNGMILIPIK